MLRLIETFFRHRLLLLGPVGLVVVATVGWVLVQPPMYDSSVRIWAERQTLVPDPNDNPYLTPAQQEGAVLAELLTTKYFCAKVGWRSQLAQSIKASGSSGGGLRTQVLRAIGLGGPSGPMTDAQVEDQVFSIVSASTVVVPTGPEIITVTFRGGNPAVSQAVAQAVGDQFMDESLANQRVQADAAVAFYAGQVKQTAAEVAVSDKGVDDYLAANPGQRATSATPDAKLVQLRRDDDAARSRLATIQDKLDQARLTRAGFDQTGASGLRVLDKAEVPTRASSSKKTLLQAGGVAAVLALLILVVGVLLLTWLDSTIRRPQEVEAILDLRPVGSVPRVS
jgi:uncharacterized protein involved in exopolysaccharide biosynthesis